MNKTTFLRFAWTRPVVLSAIIALLPMSVAAWGDGGHMIVARLAYDHLNAVAKKSADHLLAGIFIGIFQQRQQIRQSIL